MEKEEKSTEDAPSLEALKTRLKAKGMSFEDVERSHDFPAAIWVDFPNGKKPRRIFVTAQRAETIYETKFEEYSFVGDYEAICSYTDGIIEAGIRGYTTPTRFLIKRIRENLEPSPPTLDEEQDEAEIPDTADEIKVSSSDMKCTISISPASNQYRALVNRGGFGEYTLKISNSSFDRHDVALSILEKMANAFFFEIDIVHNFTLNLTKTRTRPLPLGARRRHRDAFNLRFPAYEFDLAPLSLYWYSRSARGMPLLQFLALYQVVEYYFPTYSQKEAGRRIRGVIKDPSFRLERDSDIGRLLSVVKSTKGGSIGNEREQLRATLYECVDPSELRSFLTEYEARKEFFTKKHKGLTDEKIPLESTHIDPRDATANAIYDIRCKIVHTKLDGDERSVNRLLPFSTEANLLTEYILLMQYIAQRVLIAAGTPLNISG